jgi:hypothetical protein
LEVNLTKLVKIRLRSCALNIDLPYLVHTLLMEGTCTNLWIYHLHLIWVLCYFDLAYYLKKKKKITQTICRGQVRHRSVSKEPNTQMIIFFSPICTEVFGLNSFEKFLCRVCQHILFNSCFFLRYKEVKIRSTPII